MYRNGSIKLYGFILCGTVNIIKLWQNVHILYSHLISTCIWRWADTQSHIGIFDHLQIRKQKREPAQILTILLEHILPSCAGCACYLDVIFTTSHLCSLISQPIWAFWGQEHKVGSNIPRLKRNDVCLTAWSQWEVNVLDSASVTYWRNCKLDKLRWTVIS